MSTYCNNKQKKKVGLAKELMNITIFCKEEDEKGDIFATICKEGMEKTFDGETIQIIQI